jgi:predicted transcriptional regulator
MSSVEFRHALIVLGLSHPEAARLLGTSKNTVQRYTKGKAIPKSVVRLLRYLLTSEKTTKSIVSRQAKSRNKSAQAPRGVLAEAFQTAFPDAEPAEIAHFLFAEAFAILRSQS